MEKERERERLGPETRVLIGGALQQAPPRRVGEAWGVGVVTEWRCLESGRALTARGELRGNGSAV